MGLGNYFKNLSVSTDLVPVTNTTTPGQPPSRRQLYQSRVNRGPNLGSMFVLEKWIAPHLFPEGDDHGKTSELDAVKQALKAKGVDKTRTMFETHWREWISDDDWRWLREMGATAVRVPIGYWMVGGGQFCDHTHFEDVHKVYEHAWDIFKDVVLRKAAEHEIGVLVDLHGLPGGANGADHSGTTVGEPKLWGSSRCQVQSYHVLHFLATELAQFDNVVALQILNEAPYESHNEDVQKTFYLKAINQIRSVNTEIPLVISDGWDLNRWVDIVKELEHHLSTERGENASLGIIIDTHIYRCFSDDDKNKAPIDIIKNIEEALPNTESTVDIMVGEFSCVLDGQSWNKHNEGAHGSREELVKQYGQRECAHFAQRACGFYFWTYKFKWGGGGEWGFREMLEKGALSSVYGPSQQRFPQAREPTDNYYDEALAYRCQQAIDNHANYWQAQDPNRDWEHWRFEAGFRQAWADARAFDKWNHSELGRRAAWKRARELEHIRERGAGHDIIWVWRQGFDQGLQAFLETRDHAFHG
jgi:glucan 1,3-beta-glucosidase